ncbi:cytochrome P450 monooxygenase pc-bph [Obba rivulosa]|uniref:Cytochrome P450 monooxygenase pc-bph n=1 Tax=Obba rivulosa TaxID=1052685 RepID=A0A8E2ARF3_9APHY|nr:cytochrome P450 monooxygenase pc-bph [Obba rivulosa]
MIADVVMDRILTKPVILLCVLPAVLFAACFLPYVLDRHHLRSYPGPFLAKFTDLWLAYKVWEARRSAEIHLLHKKYGPFLRIGPNHVSIADPAAIPVLYSHSNPLLKSDFYDGFTSFRATGLFVTRDRAVHARKRRIVSHLFAPKTVKSFEPAVQNYVRGLLSQWDNLCENAEISRSTAIVSGTLGSMPWQVYDGRVWFNCMPWLNFLAFDTIGDLAFGKPFGMLESGKDIARVAKDYKDAMRSYNSKEYLPEWTPAYEEEEIPAVSSVNARSEYTILVGTLPRWMRRMVWKIGNKNPQTADMRRIMSMAASSVARRIRATGEKDRDDFLTRLLQARDDNGNPLSPDELSAEAQTLLIAGSDTISNSTCATIYWVSRDPSVEATLQAELDKALGDISADMDGPIAPIDKIEHLPYLNAVVDEALRIHSTVAAGLPRDVPPGGITVLGHFFPEGTVLSVPIYSAHRDEHVWAPDPEAYRPERWLEADKEKKDAMNKAFVPFSVGPRACVGRNLAKMQLLINVASIFRCYDVALQKPNEPLPVSDNFTRKPMECYVGLKRREM